MGARANRLGTVRGRSDLDLAVALLRLLLEQVGRSGCDVAEPSYELIRAQSHLASSANGMNRDAVTVLHRSVDRIRWVMLQEEMSESSCRSLRLRGHEPAYPVTTARRIM